MTGRPSVRTTEIDTKQPRKKRQFLCEIFMKIDPAIETMFRLHPIDTSSRMDTWSLPRRRTTHTNTAVIVKIPSTV